MPTKSKNHHAFVGEHEYIKVGSDIYRATITDPIMDDGMRYARWFCTLAAWPCFLKVFALDGLTVITEG